MGQMVSIEEFAAIHDKSPQTVKKMIYINTWPQVQKTLVDGKLTYLLDAEWPWPHPMTPTRKRKLLAEIAQQMPPVIYATAADGTVICLVSATTHSHVVEHGTADDMNDLWRVSPAQRAAGAAALRLGWLHPDANPRNYNDKGERIYGSNKQNKPGKKKVPAERL